MKLFRTIQAIFRKKKLEADMAEEMRLHLERRIEENIADGMSPKEARYSALRKFGGLDQVKEIAREQRRGAWLEQFLNDLRFAGRQLAKSPGFTSVALLTLVLGIGATTAIFSVVNTHLLDPLPDDDENRLIEIFERSTATSERRSNTSAFVFKQVQGQPDTFAAATSFNGDYMQVSDGDFFTHVVGSRVTPEFFDFFRMQPLLGRWLTADERASGQEDLIVISYAWWQARFGGDPTIVGRSLKVQNQFYKDSSYTVIGVMPPQFQFPSRAIAYWRQRRFSAEELSQPGLPNDTVFARLAPGVTLEGAQALLDVQRAALVRDFSSSPRAGLFKPEGHVTRIRPMRDFFVAPELRRSLWSTAVAVGAVLLIVCANLANLQLARGESRLREMSVRAALGATRTRLVRLLLAESLLLSLLGGAGGLVLALWLRELAEALLPAYAPVLRAASVDRATLAWTAGISLFCGVAFGLLPAWRNASDGGLGQSLRNAALTTSGSRRQRWFRDGLVVAQVALALVLLAGAGLLVRSIMRLLQVDLGLNPAGLVSVHPGFPLNYYRTPEQRIAVTRDVGARLAALPGTLAVGMQANGGSSSHYLQDSSAPIYLTRIDVGTGELDYLKALGATLTSGRWLEPADDQRGQRAVIVNETLARQCWPGQSAIGQRLYTVAAHRQNETGAFIFSEVVGVVKDFKTWSLEAEVRPTYFMPAGQRDPMARVYHLRTQLDPASVTAALQRISKEAIAGPTLPQIDWVEQQLYASTATRRLLTWLLTALAALGLFLAMLGVFAVLLHGVLRRTKEIGIRVALGAQARDVLTMVFRHGLKLVALGMVAGLIGAFWATRLMRSLLFDITPGDPGVFATIPLLLLAVALLACWVPARRATKVDPMVALRTE